MLGPLGGLICCTGEIAPGFQNQLLGSNSAGAGGTANGSNGLAAPRGGKVAGTADTGGVAGVLPAEEGVDAGGSSSGGSGGGGTVEMPTPFACPTGGARTELCDDFEKGSLNTAVWTNKGGNRIKVDGEQVHSGKYALHFSVPPGGQTTAFVEESTTFPAANNTFYLRFFIFISPNLPPDNTHEAFIITNGPSGIATELGFGGRRELVTNYFIGGGETPVGAPTPLPLKQWVCLEFANESTSSGGLVIKASINGQDVPKLRQEHNRATSFSSLSVGPQQYHPIPELSDLWVDDLRVSSKPIGCGP